MKPSPEKIEYAPVMELVDMRDLRCCHLSEEVCVKQRQGVPAAHICGHDGIGRHARFRCCHLSEELPFHFRRPRSLKTKYAPVMELVDMRDLGSRAAMRVGSSPFRRTKPI